jgi:type IV secretory pathway TraG/TraD family ATPase VirD4
MLSVLFDEIAPFAYPGFTQVLQTARGAKVTFLFSFQSVPQMQRVSQTFADEICSAPGTKMIMNGSEENTAQLVAQSFIAHCAKAAQPFCPENGNLLDEIHGDGDWQ